MKICFLPICFLLLCQTALSQSFSNWITGDTADYVTDDYLPGIVLAGGGGDNDDAMKWMLQRAGGGDVVVLRASGSDGYNNYFFSQLGVNVNSVETIRFNNAAAANDPYVLQQIQRAEVLFIAGGDQYDYYQYWKGTPVGDAINFLLNEKKITVGGTSAGMAILGDAYYAPPGSSAQSAQLLANPFHPNANILGKGDFLHPPFLSDLVTDTHYDQRDRAGRHVTFMARLAAEHDIRTFGIACNEYTAVCINEDGIASVFGEHPDYDDFAYFLQVNCQDEFLPEILQSATPLTWNRSMAAVKACRVPGLVDGSNTFDLNDWQTTVGGEWFDWYVENGSLFKMPEAVPDCAPIGTSVGDPIGESAYFQITPNPASDFIIVKKTAPGEALLKLFAPTGQMVFQQKLNGPVTRIGLTRLTAGLYFALLEMDGKVFCEKMLVK